MSWDKEKWLQSKISPQLELISKIKKDNKIISHGNLWSLKKEIFIHEYIQPYVNIIHGKKSPFNRWFYFDPFSGSGLFDLEIAGQKVKFPGSPLLTYSRREKYPFHEYYFADGKKKNVDVLQERAKILFPENKLKFRYSNFADSSQFFDTLDQDQDAVLAIVDPPGFAQIPWVYVKQILEFPALDAFITIMTSGIQRNLEVPDAFDALTAFYGNKDWVGLDHVENIVDGYISRIKSETGKHVERISIDMENQKLYDLLYVTRNTTALKIMGDIADKLKQITLDDLTSIVSKTSDDVTTLLDFSD